MKKNFGKLALSSALVLALSVPVGAAASAASATPTTTTKTCAGAYTMNADQLSQILGNSGQLSQILGNNDQLSKIAGQYGIDLQSLLSQLPNGNGSVTTKPVTPAPTPAPTPSKPTTPAPTPTPSKPTTPSKPATGNSGSANAGTGSTAGNSGSGSNTQVSDYAAQVVNLVNQERAKAGLGALKSDSKLTQVAVAKAKDMYNNNYFDHNSPTYGSPFDMMKQFGVSYNAAGENIAKGQRTPAEVMNAWMNSPGHKANILNGSYKSIGVAYYNGVWVQEFTG